MTQPTLVCSHGIALSECCLLCGNPSAEFRADVEAGRYDAAGYTPAERKAKERKSFNALVAAHFKKRQGQWVRAEALMQIGGKFAWRSRVSDCRKLFGMRIDWQQRKADDGDHTISEYRFVAPREDQP